MHIQFPCSNCLSDEIFIGDNDPTPIKPNIIVLDIPIVQEEVLEVQPVYVTPNVPIFEAHSIGVSGQMHHGLFSKAFELKGFYGKGEQEHVGNNVWLRRRTGFRGICQSCGQVKEQWNPTWENVSFYKPIDGPPISIQVGPPTVYHER